MTNVSAGLVAAVGVLIWGVGGWFPWPVLGKLYVCFERFNAT